MGERPPLAAFSRRPRVCSVVVLSGRGWPLLIVKALTALFSLGGFERPGSRGVACRRFPLSADAQNNPGRDLTGAADPPPPLHAALGGRGLSWSGSSRPQ